jgi:hypothetical protein
METLLIMLESWKALNVSSLIEFYFTIFRAKVWKILILEWILRLKIQTNCKNWVCKEKSVEPSSVFTLGGNGTGYTCN